MVKELKSVHKKRKHYNIMFGTAPDGSIPGMYHCGDYYKLSGYHTVIGDYFGNGSDGDCVISGNRTLPAKVYNFRNLTICPGVVVNFCGNQAAIIRACGTLCNLGTIDLRRDGEIPAWNATYSTYGYIENKPSKGVITFTCTGGAGGRKASGVVAGAGGGYCEFGQGMNYACGGYPYCCNGGGGGSSCSSSSSAQYAVNGGNATATSGGAGANYGRDCNGHAAPGGGGGFGWICGGNGGSGAGSAEGNAYYSGGGSGGNGYLCRGGDGGAGHPGGDGGCSYCGTGGTGGCAPYGYGGRGGDSTWGNGGTGGASGRSSSDKYGCEGGNGGNSMYGNGGAGGSGGQGDCEGGKGGHGGNVLGGQYGLILAGKRLYNCRIIGCGGAGGAGGYTPRHRYSTGYEQYGGDGGNGGAGADVKMFYETLISSGTICNKGGCGGVAGTSGSGDNYRGNPGCDGGDGQLEIRNYKNVQLCIDYMVVGGGAGTPGNGGYTAEIGGGGGAVCFANGVNITNEGSLAVTVGCGGVHGTSRCAATDGGTSSLGTLAIAPGGRVDGTSGSGCTAGSEAYPRPGTYREAAGGGAGAGGNGGNTKSGCDGGDGGAGICGYGGGGGGGGYVGGGTACDGGGIGGGYSSGVRHQAANNYGGGGGGTWYRANGVSQSGADGCQGVVFVCYPKDGSYGIKRAEGGNECYECNGYCVHKFTSDGEFVPVQW